MGALGKASRRRVAGPRSGVMDRAHRWLPALAASLICGGLSLALAHATDVPVIKGELGPCSADFTVTDSASKPLYDARIHVTVRHGFMNKRKTDLEIGTNSDGKARVEGLPSKVKRPLEFEIRHEQRVKSLTHDPAGDCHANITVVLGTQ
jgi:hypothetical protein